MVVDVNVPALLQARLLPLCRSCDVLGGGESLPAGPRIALTEFGRSQSRPATASGSIAPSELHSECVAMGRSAQSSLAKGGVRSSPCKGHAKDVTVRDNDGGHSSDPFPRLKRLLISGLLCQPTSMCFLTLKRNCYWRRLIVYDLNPFQKKKKRNSPMTRKYCRRRPLSPPSDFKTDILQADSISVKPSTLQHRHSFSAVGRKPNTYQSPTLR